MIWMATRKEQMRKRNNIEWRNVVGETYWMVSNYGDFKRLEKDYTDKAGRHLHFDEKIFWAEQQFGCGI